MSGTNVNRNRLLWIVFGVVVVLGGAFVYLGRVDQSDLAALKKFTYTVTEERAPEDDSTTYRYVIQGDPEAVRAAIPAAAKAAVQPGPANAAHTVYEFKLKSGQHARLVGSPRKMQSLMMVEGKPDPMAVRALRRIGLM